jgi:hypothetical protein
MACSLKSGDPGTGVLEQEAKRKTVRTNVPRRFLVDAGNGLRRGLEVIEVMAFPFG